MTSSPVCYLDNNATTACAPEVVAEMLPFFLDDYGNPASLHKFGSKNGAAIETAKDRIRGLLGAAERDRVIFTSGGTESDCSVIHSALRTMPGRRDVVISAVEHPAVSALCRSLDQAGALRLFEIGVDRAGRIDMKAYRAALSPNVALVSMMWANNETGVLFPVRKMAREAKACGALFHSDAVQAAGKTPISLDGSDIDFLSLSAHKLHGPKGIGALFIKSGAPFEPMIMGGKQQGGARAGTENTPLIAGFGKAAEMAADAMDAALPAIGRLRDMLERKILAAYPGAMAFGDAEARLANTSAIAFSGVEAEALVIRLSRYGICASSGAACSSGQTTPSHVLQAMGIPDDLALSTVRFSLSRENRAADIERLMAALSEILPPSFVRSHRYRQGASSCITANASSF